MRDEVSEYSSGREESSAFLIWFLENFFRLDPLEAIDSVCDHRNDKGIDGLYVDDDEETIYLFQSKFSPNNNQDQGDRDIRNFVGTRIWFEGSDSINNLLNSDANRELKSLVERNNLSEKTHYKKVLIFTTNKIFNSPAKDYINTITDFEGYDSNILFDKYTYFADQETNFPQKDLSIQNPSKIEYNLPDGTLVRTYAIKAKELVKLEGIQDRTLFYKNVRYGVGNTRVNKAIKKTILDTSEHNNIFMYHNGITIICRDFSEDLTNHKITLGGYSLINGCQSMLTFFENRDSLSNNLFILVKIIKLNPTSPLVKKITFYTNNQNSISLKDLKSNDSVQKTIQTEFERTFEGNILYRRKRGEELNSEAEIIEKDFAAQVIMAFYLGKPHNTHLKQKLFGEEYNHIFSRNISANKIYLGKVVYDLVKNEAGLLNNEHLRDYGLSIFFFSHVLAEILREDNLGKQIIDDPLECITTNKAKFVATIKKVWELITPDINIDFEEYIEQNDGFLDYKNIFKNSQFVQNMSRKIKADYIRLVRRNPNNSFENIYQEN